MRAARRPVRPRSGPAGRTLAIALVLVGSVLAACTDDGTSVISARPRNAARSGISGGIGGGGSPTPGSATPAPNATQAPIVTPTPRVAVTGVLVTPVAATLYPPPTVPSATLGLPTSIQLSGATTLSNGTQGQVTWQDRSGGQLTVTSGGLVSTLATTASGSYYVRAVAVDDATQVQDVAITVRVTGELDLTLQ